MLKKINTKRAASSVHHANIGYKTLASNQLKYQKQNPNFTNLDSKNNQFTPQNQLNYFKLFNYSNK